MTKSIKHQEVEVCGKDPWKEMVKKQAHTRKLKAREINKVLRIK